ncbi:hypothetical protein BZL30_1495 [Mycobacterium kansasii]|uniref:Uncharacterized protein n=1 Tax=Mycobacterium kansasii TaxID=1768 RepID=A0A1V3XUU4_MYCKA|nr:hypothetical protein BZL30_1495 [Mycobacterium kansasii]
MINVVQASTNRLLKDTSGASVSQVQWLLTGLRHGNLVLCARLVPIMQ